MFFFGGGDAWIDGSDRACFFPGSLFLDLPPPPRGGPTLDGPQGPKKSPYPPRIFIPFCLLNVQSRSDTLKGGVPPESVAWLNSVPPRGNGGSPSFAPNRWQPERICVVLGLTHPPPMHVT